MRAHTNMFVRPKSTKISGVGIGI